MTYVTTVGSSAVAIPQDEREFFISPGSRIAALLKDAHLTQVQLAQTLGVARSTLNAYALGQRRVPVSALPVLAKALSVSLETLMGESDKTAKKRGPPPRLQQHMDRISQLLKPQQRFVVQVLESVLAQASR
jgi:transcriptional regulator with XRE-family HTH domain